MTNAENELLAKAISEQSKPGEYLINDLEIGRLLKYVLGGFPAAEGLSFDETQALFFGNKKFPVQMSQEEINLWNLHLAKLGYSLYGQLTANSKGKFLVVPGEYINSWQFVQKLGTQPVPFTDNQVKSFMSPTFSQISRRAENEYSAKIHLGFYTRDREDRYIGQLGLNYETREEIFQPSEHVSVALFGQYYPDRDVNRLEWRGVANLHTIIAELGGRANIEEVKPEDGVEGELIRLYFWQLKRLLRI